MLTTYVINLDRRRDRWLHIFSALQKQGFTKIKRISAVDGKTLSASHLHHILDPVAFANLNEPRLHHEDLGSVGAVGCYLSHVAVWKQIISSGVPGIVVEDDAHFRDSLREYAVIQDPLTTCRDYDFVLLGYSKLRKPWKAPTKAENLVVPLNVMFFGTAFYYITPQGASKLLQRSYPIEIQVDSFMGQTNLQGYVKAGVHLPSLARDQNFGTDIQTNPCVLCDEDATADWTDKYMPWLFLGAVVVAVLAVSYFRYPR
jgi:glycosyl transferase, family 25